MYDFCITMMSHPVRFDHRICLRKYTRVVTKIVEEKSSQPSILFYHSSMVSHTFSIYSRMKIKKREVLAYKMGCTQPGYSTSAKLFASFSRFFCVKAHTI